MIQLNKTLDHAVDKCLINFVQLGERRHMLHIK